MMVLLTYGFKVAVLLLIGLGFYRLLLEREALGRFKRAFLLFMLVFAHLVPLLPVRELSVPAPAPVVAPAPTPVVAAAPSAPNLPERPAGRFDPSYLFGLVYTLGLIWAGRRFVLSIRRVVRQVRLGHRRPYGRAWTIELPGRVAPHSFGRWIFYGAQNPPSPAILAHEYAHVAEWHTLDRLFIAVLRTVCWFNPLLYLYERAIIFNHEYLADRAVLRRGFPPRDYQYGLLAALGRQSANPRLSSGADFHFTKKRLQMMLLPSASPARATILWSFTVALGLLLLWSFGRTTVVLVDSPDRPTSTPSTESAERDRLPPPPSFTFRMLERRQPTAEQVTAWLDADTYGIWIDGRRIDNADLADYELADFSYYTVSRLLRNARNYEVLDYEVNLTTNATFQRNRYQPNWQSSSCRWEPTPVGEGC